jgi:hypothetical protein
VAGLDSTNLGDDEIERAVRIASDCCVEFGSRPRNVVFDIFTANGSDMVFTEYGDHWRRMRRVMTLPFFTVCVVQQYMTMCGRLRWTTSSPTCAVTRWHMSPVSWWDVGYNSCPTISCVA